MHMTTHVSTAVRPSALGALAVTELKMFTSTRNSVTSRAMRPARKERKGDLTLHCLFGPRSSNGKKNKRAVVEQLLSACVSL